MCVFERPRNRTNGIYDSDVTKLSDSAIASIPEIDMRSEANGDYVVFGPIDHVEIVVVLEGRSIKDFHRDFIDASFLFIKTQLLKHIFVVFGRDDLVLLRLGFAFAEL